MRLFTLLLISIAICLAPARIAAQSIALDKPPPDGPEINHFFPMGVQRGTTLDLTITGKNLAQATGLLTTMPARITLPESDKNDATKVLVKISVPPDALPGLYPVRLVTKRGISNFRLFSIDDLPEVLSNAECRSPEKAQPINVPCVVSGTAQPEVTHYYKFNATKGQRISFEVEGRRLGSPVDPQIELLNANDGQSLAFSDDAPSLSKDPRLTFTFPKAGEFILAIRDVRYQGGNGWGYRLRIGDFPCATTPFPLAVQRGCLAAVRFAGPQVADLTSQSLPISREFSTKSISVIPQTANQPLGRPVCLSVTDLDEQLEAEPNDGPEHANPMKIPGAINARLKKKGDKDYYRFQLAKGQRILLKSNNQLFHSPTMVYMTLSDKAGKQLAACDPKTDPPTIDFTAKEEGELTLMVEHLHYWGGPSEVYRVTAEIPAPDFAISTDIDRVFVPAQGAVIINVRATREQFTGPIEIDVTSPASLVGRAVIPKGQDFALLRIEPRPDAPLSGDNLQLQARAVINGTEVVRTASIRELVKKSLDRLPFPPQHLSSNLAAAVIEKSPYTITASFESESVARGTPATIVITAQRDEGFDEEITVSTVQAPPSGRNKIVIPDGQVKIPKGSTEAKLVVKPPKNAATQSYLFGIVGTSKVGEIEYRNAGPMIELNVTKEAKKTEEAGSP